MVEVKFSFPNLFFVDDIFLFIEEMEDQVDLTYTMEQFSAMLTYA